MNYRDEIVQELRAHDDARPRSQQTEIGLSRLLDCRAAIGFTLDEEWVTDDADTWRALVGTALHSHLQMVRAGIPGVRHEVSLAYRGVPGHADEVGVDPDEVREWKFPGLAQSKVWRSDAEAFLPKRVQAHTYAAGLVEAGVMDRDCDVVVLVAPVDGTFDDWWECRERFDPELADGAIARLEDVKDRKARGEPLPKDKPYVFCERYCPHFTRCRGADDPREMAEITDPELAAAVERYGVINAEMLPLAKEKDKLAGLIRGLHGVARGWQVKMTKPSGMKWVPDMDAVRAHFAAFGEDVPAKQVPSSSPSLSVTKQRTKKGKP